MKIEIRALDELSEDPANVRRHPPRNIDAITGSLLRFGQVKPIVINPKGVILAGNGLYRAARELAEADRAGVRPYPGPRTEDGRPGLAVIETDLRPIDATSYAIADNRTAELAEWDADGLAKILAELEAEDPEAALATGFDADEFEALLRGSSTSGANEGSDGAEKTLGFDGLVPFSFGEIAAGVAEEVYVAFRRRLSELEDEGAPTISDALAMMLALGEEATRAE